MLDFLRCTAGYRPQVLVLGAGYDTTFFQLAAERALPPDAAFIELDFPEVTAPKAAAIAAAPALREALAAGNPGGAAAEVDAAAGVVTSPAYRLFPADLRRLDQVDAALAAANADFAAPTLVIAECVLVYMPPAQSDALLAWLGARLACAAAVVYEQVNLDDAFGCQMATNLAARGCPLLGCVPSLDAHAARLRDAGFPRAEARSMAAVYAQCLDPGERRRAERLEMFDEFEEWDLMQAHYALAVGVKAGGEGCPLGGFGFPRPPEDPRVAALAALLAAKAAAAGGTAAAQPPP